MARILGALIVAIFTVLIVRVGGDETLLDNKDLQVIAWNEFFNFFCNNTFSSQLSICNQYSTTTTTPSTSTSTVASTTQSSSIEIDSTTTTTMSPSALERAHWCRFSNGTYIPLGYTFMYNECALCQCIDSHAIRCTNLQCMPTYCIDGSTPTPKPGQCCPQCAYENTSTACIINGVTFPHGTLLRRTSDNLQCWCQLGGIECRKGSASLFSGMDYWGDGTAVYVIVIVICVMLILGTLICCGGTFLFYYYYQRNQQTVQETYAEYYNNAGWQPMSEDGTVVIDNQNEEKQVEAEQKQQYEFEYPTGHSEEYIPPPYALYNGSYVQEKKESE